MLHTVTHFFLHANPFLIYSIVAVVLMLESSGVPIANNTLLLFTGALASLGHLDIWILAATAMIGSVAGACLAYWLGMRGGQRVLLYLAKIFRVDLRKVETAERWFQKSGRWMIFFSRMTPYVRPFACFPAGIAGMLFSRFFISACAGSVLWCAIMLSIGWGFGRRWSLAVSMIQHYTIPTLCFGGLVIVLYCFSMYMIGRRFNVNRHV